jgi:predicted RNA binding protein YcfA (HicA-like mRNA interferase family)
VSKIAKTLQRVLCGASDANLDFDEVCSLLRHLGFEERIRGSHHIFTRDGIDEILNLQPRNRQAKPYQVKQIRGVILDYHLAGDSET